MRVPGFLWLWQNGRGGGEQQDGTESGGGWQDREGLSGENIAVKLSTGEPPASNYTAGESHTSPWVGEQDPFTESMAEAGKSVVDALDQACVDLVYASQDDTASLIERMESRNAVHVLEHGEEIGLGSRSYQMVSIDG